MSKIMVLNGPNINMLGIREINIYGNNTYSDLVNYLKSLENDQLRIEIYQSNHEGEIIDLLHQAYFMQYDGIVINPGAYTHYSYAIYDAIKAINIRTIEVHISDITTREDFRKVSVISDACIKTISGKGFLGYKEAIEDLK